MKSITGLNVTMYTRLASNYRGPPVSFLSAGIKDRSHYIRP